MPNIASVMREEISRLSRREIRKETASTKRATAQHRRAIAALKTQIAHLERRIAAMARTLSRAPDASTAGPEDGAASAKVRFSAKGLHAHRARLGLSANDFGKLVGVSAQSVYNWEQGQSVPRAGQLAKIAALRTIGKRAARQRLDQA